jgi:hypothetical protein
MIQGCGEPQASTTAGSAAPGGLHAEHAPRGTIPDRCLLCQGSDFEHVGFGLWDGKEASGVFHKARCRGCGVVWYGPQTHDEADRGKGPVWVRCDW